MAKRTIFIRWRDDEILRLFSGPSSWEEAEAVVTAIDGIESWDNIEIETAPKLFGNGEYVVSKRIAGGDVTIAGDLDTPERGIHAIYETLRDAAASLEEIEVEFENSAAGHANKSLRGIITALRWTERSETSVEFSLTLRNLAGDLI